MKAGAFTPATPCPAARRPPLERHRELQRSMKAGAFTPATPGAESR